LRQIVYCVDVDSLRDLWAMCDRINVALRSVLLPKKHPSTIPLLVEFALRRARTRVSISGPQLLRYKQHLVDMREQQYGSNMQARDVLPAEGSYTFNAM